MEKGTIKSERERTARLFSAKCEKMSFFSVVLFLNKYDVDNVCETKSVSTLVKTTRSPVLLLQQNARRLYIMLQLLKKIH